MIVHCRRAIIFAETKRDAHAIGAHCESQGLPVGVLTGDRTQQARENIAGECTPGLGL